MKRFLACVAVQNMVDRRPSVRCMHPIPGGRATLAFVKQVAVKPYSHVHDPACSSCFFEDQGLTGLIHQQKTFCRHQKNRLPVIKYDSMMQFNLLHSTIIQLGSELWISIAPLNETFSKKNASASKCVYAIRGRNFQGIGSRGGHWLYMWLSHHCCFIDLFTKKRSYMPSTSPRSRSCKFPTKTMGSKAWEFPNGRDDGSNFCKDINQKKSIPISEINGWWMNFVFF